MKRIVTLFILLSVFILVAAYPPVVPPRWHYDSSGQLVPVKSGAVVVSGQVSDTAYNASTWDGVDTIAPSKNAVRDKIEAIDESAIEGYIFDSDSETVTGQWTFGVSPHIRNATPGIYFWDTDAPGSDKETGTIFFPYVDGLTDAENADFTIAIKQNGSLVTIATFDESDDQWETTKNFTAATYGSNASVSDAELLYVDATSSIQTQLDARALESVVGTSLNADDLELNGAVLQTAAEIPHVDATASISAIWTWVDDLVQIFGTGSDAKVAWDDAAARLEWRNSGDTPIFWMDFANSAFGVAAVAAPSTSGYDSDAAGTARTDEWAGSVDWNLTTTTEDATVGDWGAYIPIVSVKSLFIEIDGSDEAITLGDSVSGEDLKFDFETATDNQVEIGSNSGVTDLSLSAINLTTTGYVSGQANTLTDTSGVITLTVNAVNYGSDTGKANIPDGACDAAGDVGNWVVLISSVADAYQMTSDDETNQFIIAANAAALTANDELDVDGTMVSVMCIAAELWKVTGYMGAIPTDGGAPE
uniref:Uncharacterized protein n=1 Tax=viral metagenome TaxID=1070528 RepID=A0A6M3J1J5_9ZZZZ